MAPVGTTTRPTPDRVREATFNALWSLGAVADASVLDLYAGSGALGIEALSRGAARCTFVDAARPAREAVTANLAACGMTELATVVAAPAERALADWARDGTRFDLALLDPPYEFDAWDDLLAALPADLAVAEASHPVEPAPGWDVLREKRYGRTHVTILRRSGP